MATRTWHYVAKKLNSSQTEIMAQKRILNMIKHEKPPDLLFCDGLLKGSTKSGNDGDGVLPSNGLTDTDLCKEWSAI